MTESAFLTADEAGKELGVSKKGIYRCAARAEAAGHTVRTRIGSVRFVLRSALAVLRQFHYNPHDESPEAVQRRKEWGSRGSAAAAKSPKRGRPPRPTQWHGDVTLRDLKAMRKFVNDEFGGDIEAAETAIVAFADLVEGGVEEEPATPERGNEQAG